MQKRRATNKDDAGSREPTAGPTPEPKPTELNVDVDEGDYRAPSVAGPKPSEEVDPSGRSAIDYGELPTRSYVGQSEEEE